MLVGGMMTVSLEIESCPVDEEDSQNRGQFDENSMTRDEARQR